MKEGIMERPYGFYISRKFKVVVTETLGKDYEVRLNP